MCGIVAYIGDQKVNDLLLTGLKRLEYRGYDSAGLAVVADDKLHVKKKEGKVDELVEAIETDHQPESTLGIAHTRWATHGNPSDVNAHPHTNAAGDFALVHNGIIENYDVLRKNLEEKGYEFKSETDTEALVHLIDDVRKETDLSLPEAVRQALTQVVGTYGIAVVSANDPDLLIAARKGSPLLLGVGEGENFVASDAAPLVEHTRKVVYLNDGEIATVRRDGFDVKTIGDEELEKEIHELEWDLGQIEKGGYEHFMLKEIMEQPNALEECMRGRLLLEDNTVHLGGLTDVMDELREAERIILVACGTSWHSALVGEYLIEYFTRIPVEVEYASEFRYRHPILHEDDMVIAISQSGETADTLAAVREAQDRGATALGVVNVVGSSIARETDAGVYLHAGPEIGVASTKAFTGQVMVLTLLAMKLSEERGTLSKEKRAECLQAIADLPDKVRRELERDEEIAEMSKVYRYADNFLYLGRGYNFPVALEGALKLKEISYVHAEGYPAAEMKHGPIALVTRFMPVIFIAMKDSTYDKVKSNIEEVIARDGSVIAITDADNHELDDMCEYVMRVPETMEFLLPLLTVVPLQLLSYHMAVLRGCDVDQPRNLAKSVTVE
ncbi:MAG: glutamine--fructose-6-phosphate transaminase (isomerizing) [Bacteroidetes bacterium QS_8_64_10]|nr:MAG: glutamine--fructose-6-phosphate transaminase (isomerizing) [Bacteroidetes bacterium QS_8_64_10]